jgi:hypothetical protein
LQKALIKKAGFESQISELKEFAAKEKLEIVQSEIKNTKLVLSG